LVGHVGEQSSELGANPVKPGFVAFSSTATDLVPGDTNGLADVFVRDRWKNKTDEVIAIENTGNKTIVERGFLVRGTRS
jgi:hypothetical protein